MEEIKTNDQSKIFQFQLSIEDCLKELDKIKAQDEKRFNEILFIGNEISVNAKEENLEKLQEIINKNLDIIHLMRLYVEEAFESVLSLRFNEVIEFFLQKGLDLEESFPNAVFLLIDTSRYFPEDPPVETLQLLIKYGLSQDRVEKTNFRSALHLSCKYGLLAFVECLVKNGCELTPVDRNSKTPYQYADAKRQKNQRFQQICQILEQSGGEKDWKRPNYKYED